MNFTFRFAESSHLFTVIGAIISFISTLALHRFLPSEYIGLRELIVFSSLFGILVPMGLDNAFFKLEDSSLIKGHIFWTSLVILILSLSIFFIENLEIVYFSFVTGLFLLFSSFLRFKSLGSFYFANSIVFRILFFLLILLYSFNREFLFSLTILLAVTSMVTTIGYWRRFTFSFLVIGLQGVVISQFTRLLYYDVYWQNNEYLFYDIFISINGLLWSLVLVYDRIEETNLAKSSIINWQYLLKFLPIQVVIHSVIFVVMLAVFKKDSVSFYDIGLIFFLSVLSSLPPFLKYLRLGRFIGFTIIIGFIELSALFYFKLNSISCFGLAVLTYFLYFLLAQLNDWRRV